MDEDRLAVGKSPGTFPSMEDRPQLRNPLTRAGLVVVGLVALGLGIAGFVVPGLPGTPFLLVAAWAFSMSNARLYRWMLTNRWFGPTLSDYRAGLGIPRRIKTVAITSVIVVVSLSVTLGIDEWWLRILVVGLGVVGVVFILTRPTREFAT